MNTMARTLEELPVYKAACDFSLAVIALLEKPEMRRNRTLWDQIAEANDSIISNMAEGFEQATDAGFAKYLGYSKASLAEVLARLKQAERRKNLTQSEIQPQLESGDRLGRMLGGFIKYLKACGWKDRGSFKASHEAPPAAERPAKDPSQPAQRAQMDRVRDS